MFRPIIIDQGHLRQATDADTLTIAGYLTEETDPVFGASVAAGITAQQVTDWDTAFGWGNHAGLYDLVGAAAGAVTSHEVAFDHALIATALQVETDPLFSAWLAGDPLAGYLTEETDPVFSASVAAAITAPQVANWDTAYGWGNHAGLYDLVGAAASAVSAHELAFDHALIATALQVETDPLFSAWLAGDPLAGYLTEETDPVFGASVAAGITAQQVANWDTAFGWGNHAGLYEPAGAVTSHELAFDHALIATALQVETDPLFSAWLAGDPLAGYALEADTYTKEEVNNLIAGASFDYYLSDTGSDIAGYYTLSDTPSVGGVALTATVSADDTLLKAYATVPSEPSFSTLSEGSYHLHLHASATTTGTKTARVFGRLYKWTAGVETLIGTTDQSGVLTSSETQYDLHMVLAEETALAAGDRLVVKVHANIESATGTDPDVTIYFGGITDSRIELKTTISAFDSRYAPIDHDHAGVYEVAGAVAAHELAFDHALIATALQVETDPLFSAWLAGDPLSGFLTEETDPVFSASVAAGITAPQVANWDTAYGWGDHAGLYDLVGAAAGAVASHEAAFDHALIATALQVETDPLFSAWLAGDPYHLDDNEKFTYGNDNDAAIYYDGTNLVVNPKEVGSGLLNVLGSAAVAGNVGIGTTTPAFALDIAREGVSSVVHMRTNAYGNFFLAERCSGTLTEPAATGSGITLFALAGGGHTGVDWAQQKVQISCNSGGVWSATSTPTYITLETTPINSTAKVERLRIDTEGNVKVPADNKRLYFGAGDDASVYYDGTNLVVNPKEVGSGVLSVLGCVGLENTTSSSTGVIYKGGNRFLHNFQHPTGSTAVPLGYNTFLGQNAGNFTVGSTATANYHGSYNTGVGYATLGAMTTGYQNVAIGPLTGYALTTGYQNIAIGHAALYTCQTGNANVALGYESLKLATGANNIGIGRSALTQTTTGSSNVAIGSAALNANTTGSINTGVGGDAGRYIADGVTGNLTSNYGLYLGYGAKALADGGSNEIVIGYNATGAGSNSVVVGNDSITKTLLKGNVGIGTTAPAEPLHIKTNEIGAGVSMLRLDNDGTVANEAGMELWATPTDSATSLRSGRIYAKWDGVSYVNSRLSFQSVTTGGDYVDTLHLKNGNVGIGITTPGAKLDVYQGTATAVQAPATSGTAQNNPMGRFSNVRTSALDVGFQYGSPFGIWVQAVSTVNLGIYYPLLLNPNGGNVGIGTTLPDARADVTGTKNTGAYYRDRQLLTIKDDTALAAGTGGAISFQAKCEAGGTYAEQAMIEAQRRDANPWEYESDLVFYTRPETADLVERLRLTYDGDVKIPADNAKLYFGAANDACIYFNGNTLIIDPNLVTATDPLKILGQSLILDNTSTAGANLILDGKTAFTNTFSIKEAGTEFFRIAVSPSSNKTEIANRLAGDDLYFMTTGSGSIILYNGSVKLRADNQKLYFGAADDASIYYDGTNLVVNPQEAGTGRLDVRTSVQDDHGVIGITASDAINTVPGLGKQYGIVWSDQGGLNHAGHITVSHGVGGFASMHFGGLYSGGYNGFSDQVLTLDGTGDVRLPVTNAKLYFGEFSYITQDPLGPLTIYCYDGSRTITLDVGEGRLQADSTGNARGNYVTDWQRHRTNADEVASGAFSTISGGSTNKASGDYSTVGGGKSNIASGYGAAIAGGLGNEASASYSAAGGQYAKAALFGQQAQASGQFAAVGDAQTSVLTLRRATTAATTWTPLYLSGTLEAEMVDGQVWAFTITVVAKCSTNGDIAVGKIEGFAKRASGTVTVISAVTTMLPSSTAGYDCRAVASSGNLRVEVQAATANETRWVARVELTELVY